MVHNGIEYGMMQLLAETYDLLKRGLGLNDDELHDIFTAWNKGELNGYLVEITGHIFAKRDEKTGQRLIDEILDVAQQKAPAYGPRKARWNCKCRSRRLIWRSRCGTCQCSQRNASRRARCISEPYGA